MDIPYNILKYYLRNVYFITGTAYAGKSTMVRMLADRYGLVFCGENYHIGVSDAVATPDLQPDLCYRRQLTDWRDFVTRSPEEYERWIYNSGREGAGFEIAELISLARDNKVIADTSIPLDILREIADYHQVAVMLSPQSMSVDRFFDRSDPDKQFLLNEIDKCPDPEKTMANFRACLARINSPEVYERMKNSGFFVHERLDAQRDTREETMRILARHFGLEEIC